MRRFFQIFLPLLVIGLSTWAMTSMIRNKEEPRMSAPPAPQVRVEATRLKPETFQVMLETRGTVRPRTAISLLPEVAGRIVSISPSLREGAFFEESEVLLQLEPGDYEIAVTVAEGAVAQAEAALAEEQARAEQALENWQRLGKSGDPSPLVLRQPQLKQAEANLAAAKAQVAQARRDLERTTIRAPFAGRVTEKLVDIGQYVTSGTPLAQAYAVDYVEIRLPLSNDDLAFVDLPESYRNAEADEQAGPPVTFRGRIGGQVSEWSGRIVRVEGAIDAASRQLFVVAHVDDPYRKPEDGGPPMKIGLFVEAEVEGKALEDVFILPRSAVRPSGEVLTLDENHRIRRKVVVPIWTDDQHAVIPNGGEGGLDAGEIICLTPLAYPVDGASVIPTIDGVSPTTERPGSRPVMDGDRKPDRRPTAGNDRPKGPKGSAKPASS